MTPVELVKTFCELNGLPLARLESRNVIGVLPPTGTREHLGNYVSVTRTIRVYPDLCDQPGERSWPGWIMDLTVTGVVAHELGHHLSYCDRSYRSAFGLLRRDVPERPLTEYACRSAEEDLAETVMLYVTNPTLLAAMRPVRHSTLAIGGLRSPETRHWAEVLDGSPALRAAAQCLGVKPTAFRGSESL